MAQHSDSHSRSLTEIFLHYFVLHIYLLRSVDLWKKSRTFLLRRDASFPPRHLRASTHSFFHKFLHLSIFHCIAKDHLSLSSFSSVSYHPELLERQVVLPLPHLPHRPQTGATRHHSRWWDLQHGRRAHRAPRGRICTHRGKRKGYHFFISLVIGYCDNLRQP